MGPVIADSVTITRPVETVFGYVTDPDHWAEWSTPVVSVQSSSPGPVGPDASFTVAARLLGRRFDTAMQVTDYEANRLLAYRSVSGPVPSTFTWRFDPMDGSTGVTQTVTTIEEETRGFFRLAYPVIEAAYRRQMSADLATLKDLLKQQAG